MSQRDTDALESARWKKKFLDALEVHDQREKNLINRIKLLRRGLVGVSLAGDGLDATLDRDLGALRASLRADESEAGLEALLERIERTVLRLDTRKEESSWAIQNALNLGIGQLQTVRLPPELKRSVRQFAKQLPQRIKNSQNHPELIVQYLELLRAAVRELVPQTAMSTGSGQAMAATSQGTSSFWTRLFSPSEPSAKSSSPVLQPQAKDSAPVDSPQQVSDPLPSHLSPEAHAPADQVNKAPEAQQAPAPQHASEPEPQHDSGSEPDPKFEPEPESESEQFFISDAVDAGAQEAAAADADHHGEPEPGFSAIANHAEPVLLRILENIYITEQSLAVATKVRNKIARGLNWYEFVSVLEDISAVIMAALEQERTEFQRFLNELNASLGEVQEYVHFSREQEGASRASEAALDAAVRTQISGISDTVQVAEDISELKSAVQGQLSSILSSMDQFKAMKARQQEDASEHAKQLEQRLQAMEAESRELRMHLAQQEQLASRDALTELPNRAAYDRRVHHEAGIWRTAGEDAERPGLCLVVCDVDHFKHINDTYGHLAGDKVLKILAKEITGQLRKSDFVARYGGEEFVILLMGTALAEARTLIDGVRMKIERCPFHFKAKQVQITMSFGLAAFAEGDTPEKVFERADKALYRAKRGGRNQVCLEQSKHADSISADIPPVS
jgi:diguanylate cyclase